MKAIFLDRDGTLIRNIPYLKDPKLISVIPGCSKALKFLQEQGYLLIVVTNQSGIGRGLVTENELEILHTTLQDKLEKEGVRIDHFYYCPHLPADMNANPCDCRKPKPGLFLNAISELGIDPSQSFTIGDNLSDLEAGHQAGTQTILFDQRNENGKLPPWILGKIRNWNELLPLINIT